MLYAIDTVFYAIERDKYGLSLDGVALARHDGPMERLINADELAEILGVSSRTVDTWRAGGEGPDYIKVGAQIRYRPVDVEDWLKTVRIIQGNTAGREKPGPGWKDFVTKVVQPSDTSVPNDNLWRMWNQYLADEPAAQQRDDGPELPADLRHALQELIPLDAPKPNGATNALAGIRLTTYGQNLLVTAKQREWALPGVVHAADIGMGLAGEQFALGRRGGATPTEAVIDFAQHPVLTIYGDGTGKTTALRHLIRAITKRRLDFHNPAAEAILVVFDPKRGLQDETAGLIPGEDYYETHLIDMAKRILALETLMAERSKPSTDGEASDDHHPIVYLLIDDLHTIPWDSINIENAGASPFAEKSIAIHAILTRLRRLLQHDDIGLRIIATHPHRISKAARLNERALISWLAEPLPGKSNVITLGSPTDHLIGTHDYDRNLPAGAGLLTAADEHDSGYLQLALPDDITS